MKQTDAPAAEWPVLAKFCHFGFFLKYLEKISGILQYWARL